MSATSAVAIAHLPGKDERRAKAEWPFDVGLVYLRDLLVDDEYQRPPQHAFVIEIVERFDPTLVGTIDVSERKARGGALTYAILDGQQRYLAMQQVGKTACFCSIYRGMTIADEAGFFYRKNKDRRAMKPYYAFRARIVAGDAEAIEIRQTVEAGGFALGPNSNEREVLGAVRAVEQAWAFASEYRDESLTPVLRTIRGAFFGRKGSLESGIIVGLGRFWQSFSDDEVDEDRLHETLGGTLGPQNLVGMARERMVATRRGESLPWVLARVVVELYNRKQRAGRLPANRIS